MNTVRTVGMAPFGSSKPAMAATAFSAFMNQMGAMARQRRQERMMQLDWLLRSNPELQLQAAPDAERNFLGGFFGHDYQSQNGQPVVSIGGAPYTATQRPNLGQMFPALTEQPRYAGLASTYAGMIGTPQNQQLAAQEMRRVDQRLEDDEATKAAERRKQQYALALVKAQGDERVRAYQARGGAGGNRNDPGWHMAQIAKIQQDMHELGKGLMDDYETYKSKTPKPITQEAYELQGVYGDRRIESAEEKAQRQSLEGTMRKRVLWHAEAIKRLDPTRENEVNEILQSLGIPVAPAGEGGAPVTPAGPAQDQGGGQEQLEPEIIIKKVTPLN